MRRSAEFYIAYFILFISYYFFCFLKKICSFFVPGRCSEGGKEGERNTELHKVFLSYCKVIHRVTKRVRTTQESRTKNLPRCAMPKDSAKYPSSPRAICSLSPQLTSPTDITFCSFHPSASGATKRKRAKEDARQRQMGIQGGRVRATTGKRQGKGRGTGERSSANLVTGFTMTIHMMTWATTFLVLRFSVIWARSKCVRTQERQTGHTRLA
jgi:hypothetical protein